MISSQVIKQCHSKDCHISSFMVAALNSYIPSSPYFLSHFISFMSHSAGQPNPSFGFSFFALTDTVPGKERVLDEALGDQAACTETTLFSELASPVKPSTLTTRADTEVVVSEQSVFTPPQTTIAPMPMSENVYVVSESTMSNEPSVTETYEHSDTIVSFLPERDTIAQVKYDQEVETLKDMEFDEHAELEDKHRLKTSSFEDIYTETNLDYEDSSVVPGEELEIGDRFDTRHADLHLMTQADRSSSYENIENVYKETMKEAASKDEKDIDERERVLLELEAEFDRKEKGAEETEKESPVDIVSDVSTKGHNLVSYDDELEKAEEYDDFDVDHPIHTMQVDDTCEATEVEEPLIEEESEIASPVHKATPAPGQLQKYPSPIDLTFESGLDHVGQEDEDDTVPYQQECDRESLERSQSYEASHETGVIDDFPPRQRHYSSPDEVMHLESLEDLRAKASADKGTLLPLSFLWLFMAGLYFLI